MYRVTAWHADGKGKRQHLNWPSHRLGVLFVWVFCLYLCWETCAFSCQFYNHFCCTVFNAYMKVFLQRSRENKSMDRNAPSIMCFRVKLLWLTITHEENSRWNNWMFACHVQLNHRWVYCTKCCIVVFNVTEIVLHRRGFRHWKSIVLE